MPIVHLDESDCFSANVTIEDADLLDEFGHSSSHNGYSPDTKINYCSLLLRSLFARWPKANTLNDTEAACQDPLNHGVLGVPDHTPVILSEGTGRALVRFLVRDAAPLNEQLMLCDSVPDWIRDIVVERRLPKSVRIEFFLLPALREYDEKGQCHIVPLMSMKRDCLSASDILPVRKVMEHVFQRLIKLADSLEFSPPNPSPGMTNSSNSSSTTAATGSAGERFGQSGNQSAESRTARSPSSTANPPSSHTPGDSKNTPMSPLDLPPETFQADLTAVLEAAASGDSNPEDIVEIWCGDQRLDPCMNLRSARYFYWKQSGYLILTYLISHQTSSV